MDGHGDFRSYTQSFPPAVQRYVALNLDTVPKVTNHILVFLAISDFFLLINSMRVAFATFLAASVLTFLTCFVTMVTNNNRISFAPRGLEPTEFMIGLSVGLCVAGATLSFFLSAISRNEYSFCKLPDAGRCTIASGPLWRIWWWGAMSCGANMLLGYFVAKGREEISQTQQQRYSSIDSQGASDISSLTNTAAGMGGPSSFQQNPAGMQMEHQLSQLQQVSQQNDQAGYGGYPQPQTQANVMSI